ncbi:serine/threonine-protein kinase [Streptomyces sp. NPDC059385]|uniref:serine/threonine-protein kinase n=1 Tax=Streptomyces sp. NPDC059385 TaxID=3346817 RepID=UPI0036955F5D
MEVLRPGDPPEIGGYRLLARLGSGGMGEVFLARTASGRALALKTVHRELSLEPDFADRFARETATNDRVRGPWTVSVVDFSPPGESPQWLATEYVAAPTLGDWVHRYGPLAGPAVERLARELAAALVTVRATGVVHRDIKPANVLLGPERPFLIDFGIARAVRDPRHTRTGAVIGTPGYLSPEQATGAVASAPADVFSLAAVLVYAATGRSPFLAHGEDLHLPALLYRIVHDEPLLDGVPEPLLPLLGQCLAKDPERRPTAEEVRARLGEPAEEEEWTGVMPAALVADIGRREAELGQLLDASRPPLRNPAGTGTPPAFPSPIPAPLPLPPQSPPGFGPVPFAPAVPSTAPGAPRGAGGPVSRPTLMIGAAAGAVVLAAAVALVIRYAGGGDGGRAATSTTPPAPTSSAQPGAKPGAQSSSAASLPESWVGTWSGAGPGTPEADGISRARTGRFDVTVTLRAGAVGELVGRQVSDVKEVSTGRNLGCTEALELRQVGRDTAVFAAVTSHPTDRGATFDCPQGNLYVLSLAEPDRLTLESEGAQSAGAPSSLTRHP